MNNPLVDLMTDLSGGNLGAATVLMEIMLDNEDNPDCAGILFCMIKQLGLSGADIWTLYKDECNEDIRLFGRTVILRCADKAMGAGNAALN